jgi:hypothetical protein
MVQRIASNRFVHHVLFWVSYWVLTSFSDGLYDYDFSKIFLHGLSHLPLTVLATYTFVYWIFPRFFKDKKVTFVITSLLFLIAFVLLKRISIQYFQYPVFYVDADYTFTFLNWYRIVSTALSLCATIGIFFGLKYYKGWKVQIQRAEELSREKRDAELQFLKAQLHPHFLFNSLNSLYYEVVSKSDKAPDLLIKLSDLLRFILHDCQEEWIGLDKELELIENYISIEKSRYGDRLVVHLEITGDRSVQIPPLLCFSLVENAIKHGMSDQVERCNISIQIGVEGDRISLNVSNPVLTAGKSDPMGASKGIGLENVHRQLQLLFGEDFVLESRTEGPLYTSILEFNVAR